MVRNAAHATVCFDAQVKMRDLDTDIVTNLTDEFPCDNKEVKMNDDWIIVEAQCPSEWSSIHAYNLVTQQLIAIAPYISSLVTHDLQPEVDGNNVVWIHVE